MECSKQKWKYTCTKVTSSVDNEILSVSLKSVYHKIAN